MRSRSSSAIVLLLAATAVASAQVGPPGSLGWRGYEDPSGGTRVAFPSGLFPVDAGKTDRGVGKIFRSEDGRAQFSAYSLANDGNETPRSYLNKYLKVARDTIDYERVTNRFFVVSGIRGNEVYYSRCNFRSRIHCIYMSYPRNELRRWDAIVTRVSHSLRGP